MPCFVGEVRRRCAEGLVVTEGLRDRVYYLESTLSFMYEGILVVQNAQWKSLWKGSPVDYLPAAKLTPAMHRIARKYVRIWPREVLDGVVSKPFFSASKGV